MKLFLFYLVTPPAQKVQFILGQSQETGAQVAMSKIKFLSNCILRDFGEWKS